MYFFGVLCLLAVAVALPTPEKLHTNLPALPPPPTLDDKNSDELVVPDENAKVDNSLESKPKEEMNEPEIEYKPDDDVKVIVEEPKESKESKEKAKDSKEYKDSKEQLKPKESKEKYEDSKELKNSKEQFEPTQSKEQAKDSKEYKDSKEQLKPKESKEKDEDSKEFKDSKEQFEPKESKESDLQKEVELPKENEVSKESKDKDEQSNELDANDDDTVIVEFIKRPSLSSFISQIFSNFNFPHISWPSFLKPKLRSDDSQDYIRGQPIVLVKDLPLKPRQIEPVEQYLH